MTGSVGGKRESHGSSSVQSPRRPSRRQRVQTSPEDSRHPSDNVILTSNGAGIVVNPPLPPYASDPTPALQAMHLGVLPRSFSALTEDTQSMSPRIEKSSSRTTSGVERRAHDPDLEKASRLPVTESTSQQISKPKVLEWPSRQKSHFSKGFTVQHHVDRGFQIPPCTNAQQHPPIQKVQSSAKAPEPTRYECCLELIFMIGMKKECLISNIEELMVEVSRNYNQRLGAHFPKMIIGKVAEPDGRWHIHEAEGSFAPPPSRTVKLKLISPRFSPSTRSEAADKHPITAALAFLTKNYMVGGKREERLGVENCGSAIRVFKADGWEEEDRKRLAQALVKFEQLLTTKLLPSRGKMKNWRENPHLGGMEKMSQDDAIHQIDLVARSEGLMGYAGSTSLMAMYMSPNRNHRWGSYTWDLAPKKDHPLAYRGLAKFGRSPQGSDPRAFKGAEPRMEDHAHASTVDLLWWSDFLVQFTQTALACPDLGCLQRLPSTLDGLRRFMCPSQSKAAFAHHSLGPMSR